MGGRRGGRRRSRLFVLATVMVCCLGSAGGICVIDNKKGWHVQCGVRDSYLFRLKDYGGVNANFDFSFGLGNEAGYPFSIKNTKGKHHYRRKDSTERSSTDGERREGGRGGEGERRSWVRPPMSLRAPPSHYGTLERSSVYASQESGVASGSPSVHNDPPSTPSSGEQSVPFSASSTGGAGAGSRNINPQGVWSSYQPARRRFNRRGSSSTSSSPSFFSRFISWLPWPLSSWFSGGSSSNSASRADPRNSHFRVINQGLSNDLSFGHQQSFSPQQPFNTQSFRGPPFGQQPFGGPPFGGPPFVPPPFGAPPFPLPSRPKAQQGAVGPAVADVLQVHPNTPADTDHVPSFAAKVFVVREAPKDFYPPGYTPSDSEQHQPDTVEVPRTKFFCEEQRYLPGLYADTQLGCKVFHLCLPAAVGNTQTSFLCPNMTLFDQSILQCNWWYYVRCEDSALNYDANLPLALSYRKVNAAQLPLTAIRDYNSLSLLDISARTARNLDGEEGAVGRMGLADVNKEEVEEVEGDENATPKDVEGKDDDEEKYQEGEISSLKDAKTNMGIISVGKLEEKYQGEGEKIKSDVNLNRRKRRRRSSHPIFSLPNRRHHLDSVLLSRLHRRKNMLP